MELRGLMGNQGVKRALAGDLPRSHAWIISGPAGSGRHTLATLMAQAFVCRQHQGQPCGHCPDCVKVASGIHPDVAPVSRFMAAADMDKDRELKVEAVRALRRDAFIRPNEAERKVYLIDRPLSGQDQNALLKLLEEGPAFAVFLIVVENAASLLETVRSRCTELTCTPLTEEEVRSALRQRYPQQEESALQAAAAASEGLLGQAIRHLEEQEDTLTPWVTRWLEALVQGGELALMTCSVEMQVKKFDRGQLAPLYQRLEMSFHRALRAAATGAAIPGVEGQLSGRLSQKQLLALGELARQGRQDCTFYVSVGHSSGWFAARAAEILLP
jgi:DNA polymerase-3 subunit delta'